MEKEEVDRELSKAINTRPAIEKEAPEHRVRYLEELATQYAIENKVTKDRAIREVLKHKNLREILQELSTHVIPK